MTVGECVDEALSPKGGWKMPRVKSSSVHGLSKSDTWTRRGAQSRRPSSPPLPPLPTGHHLLRPHYQYHGSTRPGSSAVFNNSAAAAAHWSCNRCPRRVWRRGFNSWWGKSWNAGGGSAAETSRHESNYDTKLMDDNGKGENSSTFSKAKTFCVNLKWLDCRRDWFCQQMAIEAAYCNRGAIKCRRR